MELGLRILVDHFVDQVLLLMRLVCLFSGYRTSRRKLNSAASGRNTVDLLEVGLTAVEMSDGDLVEAFLIDKALEARLRDCPSNVVEMLPDFYARQNT